MNGKLARSSETFIGGFWGVLANSPSLVLISVVTLLSIPTLGKWSLLVIFATIVVLYGPWRERLEAAVGRASTAVGAANSSAETLVPTRQSDHPTRQAGAGGPGPFVPGLIVGSGRRFENHDTADRDSSGGRGRQSPGLAMPGLTGGRKDEDAGKLALEPARPAQYEDVT